MAHPVRSATAYQRQQHLYNTAIHSVPTGHTGVHSSFAVQLSEPVKMISVINLV